MLFQSLRTSSSELWQKLKFADTESHSNPIIDTLAQIWETPRFARRPGSANTARSVPAIFRIVFQLWTSANSLRNVRFRCGARLKSQDALGLAESTREDRIGQSGVLSTAGEARRCRRKASQKSGARVSESSALTRHALETCGPTRAGHLCINNNINIPTAMG